MGELKLPFRDRGQDLLSAIDDTRELDGEDREVARRLMTDALLHEGKQTVGELLGDLESATREERCELVDRARSQADLPSLASVEFEAEQRRREAAAPPQRDGAGRALQREEEAAAVARYERAAAEQRRRESPAGLP